VSRFYGTQCIIDSHWLLLTSWGSVHNPGQIQLYLLIVLQYNECLLSDFCRMERFMAICAAIRFYLQLPEMRGYESADADMYPQIDVWRISAFLTDTDCNFLVWMDRIQILCHGYSTDMHYALILFFKFYFTSSVYVRHWHKLQSYRVLIIEIDPSLRRISCESSDVMSRGIQNDASRHTLWVKKHNWHNLKKNFLTRGVIVP